MDNFIPKLLVVIVNLLLAKIIAASVEILEPYHPYYVKVGDSMQIQCVSSNEDLEWTRSTPETGWSNVKIVPKEGEDWKIRTTVEQPSGFVESVLVKDNMQLGDRGNYYCRDTKNIASFSIWVTTLQVYHRNITAVEDQEEITAYCILTGFDTNPPPMVHEWYFKNEGNAQYFMQSISLQPIPYDSPRHFYHVNETEVNRLGIVIKKPKKQDTGWYQCRFTLETNISPLDIVDQFYVDTSRLPSSGSIKLSAYPSLRCLTMLMIILGLRHYYL